MLDYQNKIQIPTLEAIKHLLSPLRERLDAMHTQLVNQKSNATHPKYYRNKDLKNLFGLSNNTIVKYRETGVLPYTKLGDIYLYNVKVIDSVLKQNSVNIHRL
jgi:hypothetical protein